MRIPAIATAITLTATSVAMAHIQVAFIESAPKDRFVLINTGACALTDQSITLDLSTSKAGLIFDITSEGAGVDVFQPFELVRGADLVPIAPDVTDGMRSVTLSVPNFPAGAEIAFTVDVDDTLTTSDLGQIRISGSEIAGASLAVGTDKTLFDTTGRALLDRTACNA